MLARRGTQQISMGSGFGSLSCRKARLLALGLRYEHYTGTSTDTSTVEPNTGTSTTTAATTDTATTCTSTC